MAREIDYDTKENAHDDILNDKTNAKPTLAQVNASLQRLYDIVHDFIEYHHTKSPDA